MLISVIIPVYNAEKTIRKCVESIQIQDIKEIEIILVNDGSTDESLKICRELEAEDTRIKVLTGKNQGVSSARNKGIKEARGEYLAFIDADDLIDQQMFQSLYDQMKKNPDIIVFDYYEWKGNECKEKHRFDDLEGDEISKEDLIKRMIWQLGGTCWQAGYRREMILKRQIDFVVGRTICEDYQFFLESLRCSKKSLICKKCLYYYHISESSTTGKYMPNLEKDKREFSRWLLEYAKEFDDHKEIIEGAEAYCAMSLLYTIYNVCKKKSPYRTYRQRMRYSKQQVSQRIYKDAIRRSGEFRKKMPVMYYLQVLSIRYHMVWMDVVYYSYIKKITG